MALFKICRGAETNLPTTLTSGYCYFCTDTTNFYIDYTDTYGVLVRSKIAAKYADKLRYSQDGNYVEIDPTNIVTNSNYDTLINAATTSKNGLMAAADKEKLDGIASGANKTVVDTEVSDASENPVQNKVIKQYVDDTVPKLGITSGAAVGQLAKVKTVDENGVPTEWETGEQVQASWNQGDETAPDYIKGRICWNYSDLRSDSVNFLGPAEDADAISTYPGYTYWYGGRDVSLDPSFTSVKIGFDDIVPDEWKKITPSDTDGSWELVFGDRKIIVIAEGGQITKIGCQTILPDSCHQYYILQYNGSMRQISLSYIPRADFVTKNEERPITGRGVKRYVDEYGQKVTMKTWTAADMA